MFHPIIIESNQRFHTLSDLEEHVSYQVKICAFNVNGTGPWSDWMTIETYENDLDESVVPNEPENFKGMYICPFCCLSNFDLFNILQKLEKRVN